MGESMHYYKHNIKDFNAHTAHLTRLERDIYRQMIERYYLTEEPLTGDLDVLYRKLLIRTDEEKEAAAQILSEFFVMVIGNPTVYQHCRCHEEIQVYRTRSDKAKDAAAKRWESKGNAKALLTTNNITTKKVTKKKGPPTLKEVCNEFDGRIQQPDEEALSFFNFYESNGWKVGKNPMKSWKAAATNWINRQKKWEKERGSNKQTKQQRRDNALVQLHSE
tara:strand:- start:244 stop:903 length:660 start_codon:yes stop_codon:yes gene_type:complete